MRSEYLLIRLGALLAVAMALMATPAQALVQHSESEWTPGSGLVTPPPAVVGWWGYYYSPYYNASAVAIGPNNAPAGYLTDYVITVRHQGGVIGNGMNFGNVDYSVYDEFVNPTADLRILRIRDGSGQPAALADWAAAYSGTDETTRTDRTAVIGGFGRARGTKYASYYTWAAADVPAFQRWGQNKLEQTLDGYGAASFFGETYKSNVLIASFDAYNAGSYVPYESAVAEFDSGGGWFLPVDGLWKLVGLSAYAEGASDGKSYFSGGTVQRQYPIRISSYSNWIEAVFNRSTWQSTTGNWADAGNWSAGVPIPIGVDKFAVFLNSSSDGRTVTVSANTPFGTIRFDSRGNYTIDSAGGGGLECLTTIGAGAIEVYSTNGAGSHTITAPIKLTSPLVVNHNSSVLLTLAGPITTPSGTTGLTKVGGGVLVLSGANTFNGGLEIQKGTVRATSAGALGTPASGIVGVTLKAAGLDFRTDTDLTFTHSVKVVPLTTSALTSTLNLDRLTAGTGRKVTLGTLTTDGAVTLNVTSATGCSAAFSGKAYFTDTGSGATIYTAGADLALTGGVSMTSGTLTKSGPQKLTLSGTQTYGSGTTLQVNAGALALNADAGSASKYNLALVTGGSAAVTFGASQHLARLELGGTGTATVASGGTTTVTTKNLIISGGTSPTAKLDLNDNHLVVNYAGGADPVDTVRGYLVAGYDGSTGLWTGQGIASSAAGVIQPATTLGYLDDPVTKTVAVKYTWLGDSNLDGVVDVDNDFSAFLDGLNGVGSGWNYGDYNYDGVVDVDNDFSMFLDGLNMQQGTLGWGGVTALADGIDPSALPAEQGAAGGSGFVPEPSTLVLMALGCAAMATRRRQAA